MFRLNIWYKVIDLYFMSCLLQYTRRFFSLNHIVYWYCLLVCSAGVFVGKGGSRGPIRPWFPAAWTLPCSRPRSTRSFGGAEPQRAASEWIKCRWLKVVIVWPKWFFAIAIQSFVILSKVNLVWILMNLSKSVPAWKRGEFFYTDWRCSILELVNQTKYIFNKNSIGK